MFRLLLAAILPAAVVCFSTQQPVLRTAGIRPVGILSSPVRTPSDLGVATWNFGYGEERNVRPFGPKMEPKESSVAVPTAAVVSTGFTETLQRSAVKAFVWRLIAGSVTFVTSLKFSGSVTTALSIVGSDFFSKAFTMFIGERLMNKSNAGRESGSDGVGRSLTKALIWRLFAIANTLTLAFFVAKDLSMASRIAGSDAVFKTALMFFYERTWAKIEWGKEYEGAEASAQFSYQ